MDKKKIGFSLVELLIVVTILAALVALFLPKFGGTRRSAREARAEADCWALRTAILMYHHDTGVYPPTITTTSSFNAYLVNNPGVTGWNGPYCDRSNVDPWNNSYRFYNYFSDSKISCVGSAGENESWQNSGFTGTTLGDDIIIWME